jgi:DNA-directed RNA polymerase II subunit RPB2
MDDIVVWKTNNTDKRRDVSMRIKNMTNGVIDKVLVTRNDDNYLTVKMRARQERIPEVGDKFASRHGQKGIMGITYRQEDMPFTSEGIVPDLIVNPHAIPSRMTIGHLIECILGKTAVLTGKLGDATPFDKEFSIEGLMETLEKFGYKGDGTETMYSGITGERLTAKVFIGPTFYQRLKHMVHDKMHARSTGPLQVLTRQPVEGRSREGGLRVGELERDGMLAHGSAMFLRDRLFQCSDKYTLPVCTSCGLSAIAESISHEDTTAKQYRCSACKESQVEVVEMPYANNLFFKELMSMGIAPRVRVKQ